MTEEQSAELKRLAEKATNGPWEPTQCGGFGVIAGPTIENSKGYINGGRGQICEMDDMDASPAKQRANAKFISAANPAAVLDLLAENERLRAALDVLERCAHAVIVDCVETRDVGGLSLASEACTNARRLLES